MPKVSFTAMKDGTREDYEILAKLEKPFLALTADRILTELRQSGETTLEGYQITRLEHALQSGLKMVFLILLRSRNLHEYHPSLL